MIKLILDLPIIIQTALFFIGLVSTALIIATTIIYTSEFFGKCDSRSNKNIYGEYKLFQVVDGFGKTWYFAKVLTGRFLGFIPVYRKFSGYPLEYRKRTVTMVRGGIIYWKDKEDLEIHLKSEAADYCDQKRNKFMSKPKRI